MPLLNMLSLWVRQMEMVVKACVLLSKKAA